MPELPDLFWFEDNPIKWRRQSDATYWFMESRAPEGFRLSCVTKRGLMANPYPKSFGEKGHRKRLRVGSFYIASVWNRAPHPRSPLYSSLTEAKAACEYFRMHGSFPPPKNS